MKRKPKRQLKTLDKYIIFCFAVILIYTVIHIIAFFLFQIEMREIAILIYGAFSGEIFLCALLKKLKLKNEHEQKMRKEEVQEDDMAG